MEVIMKNHTNRVPGRPKHDKECEPIHDLIIRTASKLFMEKGYEQVSLQQIANACNVSKPSIYYHFTSKPELFKASVTTMLNNVYEKIKLLLREAESVESGLVRVAEARLANPHAELQTIINEAEGYLSEEQIQEIREAELQIYRLLADYFADAMDKQFFRKNDPMLLAQLFSSMLLIGNRKETMSQYESSYDVGRKLVDIFLHGTMER